MNDLSCIKKACAITDRIFFELVSELRKKKFSTEKDIAKFLIKKTYEKGCGLAFKPIVVTAGSYEDIHHKSTDAKLSKGFLIVDFGVKYREYCSDCTRTFYIGKPSANEKRLYELVLLSQETALMHTIPGVYAADVDLIARSILLPYFSHFRHSLGHGVGKKVHQKPTLKPRSRFILKEGQAITIEPGLYFKDMGIRIEDTIVVKNKPEILTKFTKKLIVIKN